MSAEMNYECRMTIIATHFAARLGSVEKLHLNVENMTLQYGACCSLISMQSRALFESCFIEQIN